MAKTKKQEEEEIVDVQKVYADAEDFVNKNKQIITGAVVVVAALIFGFVYYYNFYLPPLEKEAQDEMFHAQRYFSESDYETAMFGDDEGNLGFEEIAREYSSTNAGNLAEYYMGVSLLRTGDFEGAIAYLDRYDPKDEITPSVKYGAMADAYSETGDYKQAYKYYQKAADESENNFTTPVYLFKAAVVAEELDKYSEAKEFYTEIKEQYPNSQQAQNVEKYIVRAEKMANK